jgi:hypothetical protein
MSIRVIAYDRLSSREAFKTLENVYIVLRPCINFFQPVSNLVRKSGHGVKVYKLCDAAQTPYQRLLESGVLREDKEHELAETYRALNPVSLLKEIRQSVEHLCTLAER